MTSCSEWGHQLNMESYASGRANPEVKGQRPDKERPPGPPGWKFGIVITMPHKKS